MDIEAAPLHTLKASLEEGKSTRNREIFQFPKETGVLGIGGHGWKIEICKWYKHHYIETLSPLFR